VRSAASTCVASRAISCGAKCAALSDLVVQVDPVDVLGHEVGHQRARSILVQGSEGGMQIATQGGDLAAQGLARAGMIHLVWTWKLHDRRAPQLGRPGEPGLTALPDTIIVTGPSRTESRKRQPTSTARSPDAA
jgi:hypothetical protein